MTVYFPRADRLRLEIPITYRQQGDDEWFVSHVVNVSESGVLFGPTGLQPGAAVEVIIAPPISVGSRVPGPHMCAGTIVRTTEIGAAAARLESWRDLLGS
jgi:hypothetical protein